MELGTFQEISKSLEKFSSVEIAVGMEISLPDTVLISSQKGFKSTQFFRLFGSVIGGNILLRRKEEAGPLVPGGTRLCVYNNSQHTKTRFAYSLNLKSPLPENEDAEGAPQPRAASSVAAFTRNSICQVAAVWISRVLPAIAKSRLRAEVYFSLKSERLADMQKRLEALVRKRICILGCPASSLVEFYELLLNDLLRLARLESNEFSHCYILLTTFRQIAASIYANGPVSGDKMQFGLLDNLFKRQSRSLKLEVLLQFDATKVRKIADLYGGKSKPVVYCCLLLTLLWEINLHGASEVSSDWFGRTDVMGLWRKLVTESNEWEGSEELVERDEFLKLVRRKYRGSIALKCFLDMLRDLVQSGNDLVDRVIPLFEKGCKVSVQNSTYLCCKKVQGETNGEPEDEEEISLEQALGSLDCLSGQLRILVSRIEAEGLKHAESLKRLPENAPRADRDMAIR